MAYLCRDHYRYCKILTLLVFVRLDYSLPIHVFGLLNIKQLMLRSLVILRKKFSLHTASLMCQLRPRCDCIRMHNEDYCKGFEYRLLNDYRRLPIVKPVVEPTVIQKIHPEDFMWPFGPSFCFPSHIIALVGLVCLVQLHVVVSCREIGNVIVRHRSRFYKYKASFRND
jgi:hypothetical protein